MFTVSLELKQTMLDRLKSFAANIRDTYFANKDCSCSGGCGTYKEPCGCCSYHSG